MVAVKDIGSIVKPFPRKEVETALKDFWKKEAKERTEDPFAPKVVTAGTVHNVLPALGSLKVVRSFLVISKLLGRKVPVGLVKRGGYKSIGEMLNDLLPKLQKFYDKSPQTATN